MNRMKWSGKVLWSALLMLALAAGLLLPPATVTRAYAEQGWAPIVQNLSERVCRPFYLGNGKIIHIGHQGSSIQYLYLMDAGTGATSLLSSTVFNEGTKSFVYVVSENEFYYVLKDGSALCHYKDSVITSISKAEAGLSSDEKFYRMHGSSPNNIYVIAGKSGNYKLLRFDGTGWSNVAVSGLPGYSVSFSDVLVLGEQDVYLSLRGMTESSAPYVYYLMHYNGSGWSGVDGAPTERYHDIWGKYESDRLLAFDSTLGKMDIFRNGSKIGEQTYDNVSNGIKGLTSVANAGGRVYLYDKGLFVYDGGTIVKLDLPAMYCGQGITADEQGNVYLFCSETIETYGVYKNTMVMEDDSVAPVFEIGYPKAESVTDTGFSLLLKLNEAGTAFYKMVADNADPGSDYAGWTAANVAGTDEVSVPVSGLAPGTNYDVHVIAKDTAGNWQTAPVKLDVATADDATPPSFASGYPKAENITATGFSLKLKLNEAGTTCYKVVADNAGPGSDYANWTPVIIPGADEVSSAVYGLTSWTAYDVYVIAKDAAGNWQAAPVKLDVTTAAVEPETQELTGYAWQKVSNADGLGGLFPIGAGKLIATSNYLDYSAVVDLNTGEANNFGRAVISLYKVSDDDFFFVELASSGNCYVRRCTSGQVSDSMNCGIDPANWITLAGRGNDVYAFGPKLTHFNPATNMWNEIPLDGSLPAAYFYAGQCTSNYLYLGGNMGSDGNGRAVLYRYNRTAGAWENLSPDAVNPIGSAGFSRMCVTEDDSLVMMVFETSGYRNTVYSYKNGQWGRERTIGKGHNQYPEGTYVNGNYILGSGILLSSDGALHFYSGTPWIDFSGPSDLGTISDTNVCSGTDGSIYPCFSGQYGAALYKLVSTAPADETPPVITTSVADGTVTSSTYTFTVKAEDAVDGVVMPTVKLGGESGQALTGSAQGDGSYSYTAELAQGANTIYIEATDDSGNKATATFTVTYVVAAQPDLTVTNISTPDNITAGTGVTVTATIENSGTANAGSFDVTLYAGADPVETQNVASLAAGANIDVSFTWTPTAPGEVSLKTVADSGNTVTESNETNNELTKMVTVEEAQIEPDVNNDGKVNILDMILIGQEWQQTGTPGWIKEDVNQDGKIDVLDMILVGQHWTG